MNPNDYRRLSDDGLAHVDIMERRAVALQQTVHEQQQTIAELQETNRALRAIGDVSITELRRQLAESEQMRALTSDELQRARVQIDRMKQLATGAIREELLAMEELSELGYLNITGHTRLDELRAWLQEFELK